MDDIDLIFWQIITILISLSLINLLINLYVDWNKIIHTSPKHANIISTFFLSFSITYILAQLE